jgi:hypothetical protein
MIVSNGSKWTLYAVLRHAAAYECSIGFVLRYNFIPCFTSVSCFNGAVPIRDAWQLLPIIRV